MSESNMNLTVPNDMVKPIIEAKISAAIIQSLEGAQERLLEEVVSRVLNRKVNSEGKTDDYYARTPFLEWVASRAIANVTEAAVAKWIEANSAKIEALVIAELQKSRSAIVKSFVQSLLVSAKDKWNVRVNVAPKENA